MKRLARHDLTRPDGRRALVYGSLQGGFADVAESPEDVTGIHLRRDALTSGWVAITPARNLRPLDGSRGPDEDETCPLCPNGKEIPFPYDAAVFENRFPSFTQDPPPAPLLEGATDVARGRCEMVLYTQRHDASFAGLSALELTRVIAVWTDRTRELWADPAHEYVLTFENRGAEAGATLAHPHGQIYALGHVPPIVDARISAHHAHREEHGGCLGCVVARRDGGSSRVVSENASFVVSVPFAARWPYEVAVHVRRHGVGRLADLEPREQRDLAHALRDVARRYSALFGFELPYMMVAQEAPGGVPDWHLAFEFYPLQRAPHKTKIRASVETATGLFLNDVLPEEAARQLAALEVESEEISERDLWTVVPGAARARRPSSVATTLDV